MKSTLTNGVGCEGWMSELPDDVLLSKLLFRVRITL